MEATIISIMSFSANVVVAKNKIHIKCKISFIILRSKERANSFTKDNSVNLSGEKW